MRHQQLALHAQAGLRTRGVSDGCAGLPGCSQCRLSQHRPPPGGCQGQRGLVPSPPRRAERTGRGRPVTESMMGPQHHVCGVLSGRLLGSRGCSSGRTVQVPVGGRTREKQDHLTLGSPGHVRPGGHGPGTARCCELGRAPHMLRGCSDPGCPVPCPAPCSGVRCGSWCHARAAGPRASCRTALSLGYLLSKKNVLISQGRCENYVVAQPGS